MNRQLYKPHQNPETPQCQAVRSERYANDTYATDKQCKRRSQFEIEGHFLCGAHAKIKALEIVLAKPIT